MSKGMAWATALLALPLAALGQTSTQLPAPPPIPTQVPLPAAKSSKPGASERISLDDAIRLAVQHNHALQAVRTTVLQNQASEITANLRPNPVLMWDAQFIPIFQPEKFDADYIDNSAQFDLGIGYTFERGKKRQHRRQAARDVTTQSRWQVTDTYRRGAASLLDYLDAERSYRANQLAYRQALASYMLALEQMRQAVGTRNLP
jgi:outer membrane protein TolC